MCILMKHVCYSFGSSSQSFIFALLLSSWDNKSASTNPSSCYGVASITVCQVVEVPSEHKRLPSEGAVRLDHKVAATGQANAVRSWYCAKSLCQTKKASEKICDECSQRKPQNEEHWRRRDEDGCERYVARCLECEFPQCSNCGGKPGRPVLQTEKADGAWYCSRLRIYDEQLDGRHQTNPRPKQTNEEPKPTTNNLKKKQAEHPGHGPM